MNGNFRKLYEQSNYSAIGFSQIIGVSRQRFYNIINNKQVLRETKKVLQNIMKTQKLYFENKDANICYPLQFHLERAKEEGLKEIELFEAIPSSEKEYIWCSELETVGDKSECNKDCPYYKVSGKSKICDFRGKLMNFGKQLKFKVN